MISHCCRIFININLLNRCKNNIRFKNNNFNFTILWCSKWKYVDSCVIYVHSSKNTLTKVIYNQQTQDSKKTFFQPNPSLKFFFSEIFWNQLLEKFLTFFFVLRWVLKKKYFLLYVLVMCRKIWFVNEYELFI